MTTIGAASRPKDIYAEVIRVCQEAGLKPPSLDPIVRARRKALLTEPSQIQSNIDGAAVVVDSCALDLPCHLNLSGAMPVVTAAFLQPEGLIANYVVEGDVSTAFTAAQVVRPLLYAGTAPRRLILYPQSGLAWDLLMSAATAISPEVAQSDQPRARTSGHVFREIAGDSLGGISLAIRKTLKPAAPHRPHYSMRRSTSK